MATINIVLDKRRARKDGTFPLVFRLRIGKKFSDIKTDFKLRPEEYNPKSSSLVNDLLGNELLAELKSHYIKRLRIYMINNIGREDVKEARKFLINKLPNEVTIIEFWNEQIEELKIAGRHSGARVYSTALSVFSKETDLKKPFSSFSYKDLIKLEKSLYQRGLSNNGVSSYMRSFRAICNKAINFDLVDYSWYPFRKYKFKKDRTTPRVLNSDEIQAYFLLDIPKDHLCYRSWLIGKLIFMMRGINIKDLLLLSSKDIKNGRVIYKRAKTGKLYSLNLTPEIEDVLNEFEEDKTLLGILTNNQLRDKDKLVRDIIQKRKVINSHLKKIGMIISTKEPITTYVFRYTYANIARQLGFSKDMIAEALGHEYGNSVTGIYLENYDLELIDTMNEHIINEITSNSSRTD